MVQNYKTKFQEVYSILEQIEGEADIFTIASIIIGLKEHSLDAISKEALNFYGKGGIAIDTKIEDERFDNFAFLASIISYKIADVEPSMICYSIYESFGDYIGEIVNQISSSVKTKTVALSGETFANQALFARIQKRMGLYKPHFNKTLPIGNENAVFGALYL